MYILPKAESQGKHLWYPWTGSRDLFCAHTNDQCDRTKPCSACCARGAPSECRFVVNDGSEFDVIQQSYEIRDLRRDNKRLEEQLRVAGGEHLHHHDPDGDVEPAKKRVRRGVISKRRRAAVGHTSDRPCPGASTLAEVCDNKC